jgi:hypothetical protein
VIVACPAAVWSLLEGPGEDFESPAMALAGLLREKGPALLTKPGTIASAPGAKSLLDSLKAALEAEGSKGAASRSRMAALLAVKMLCETAGQWFEPYAVLLLRPVLSSYKGAKVQAALAEETTRAIIALMSPHAGRPVLEVLFEALGAYEWQVKEGSIGLMADVASNERAKAQVSKLVPGMILKLIECVTDTRPAVRATAMKVFPRVCRALVTNPDVQAIIPTVIRAYAEPDKTAAALEALSSCSFVCDVDAPTLGLMLPVLLRGMRDRKVSGVDKGRVPRCRVTGGLTGVAVGCALSTRC